MTIAAAFWPRHRQLTKLRAQAQTRLFKVAPQVELLAHCHIYTGDPQRATLLIVHGLEGSSDSTEVLALCHKALSCQMNVIRLNLRNCGGTLHLCPTLYNAGLSNDVLAVLLELQEKDRLRNIFLAGFSLGGNIVLKLADELASSAKNLLRGVCGISPSIDLLASVTAIEKAVNRLYDQRFLQGLKEKVRQKQAFFPGRFDLSKLLLLNTLRDFDEHFTAPDAGFASAYDYYTKCSALPIVDRIAVPTLIIAAQDDPIVPFASFAQLPDKHPFVSLLSPKHGGHGAFISSRAKEKEALFFTDRFWAENRVIQFCLDVMHNQLPDCVGPYNFGGTVDSTYMNK